MFRTLIEVLLMREIHVDPGVADCSPDHKDRYSTPFIETHAWARRIAGAGDGRDHTAGLPRHAELPSI
jgi:hypothetical protein